VVGKPSPEIFRESLSILGIPPGRAAMVGDDLAADVAPAQALGITGILVRTGKFREDTLETAARRPDHVIDSVADLPELLKEGP
jgi:ribonucleotide monophosphatase NagD (HAD superfamily)